MFDKIKLLCPVKFNWFRMSETVGLNPGVFNSEVTFCSRGGGIEVSFKDCWGDRVVSQHQASEFVFSDGWGIKIIDSLSDLIEGKRIITICNEKALEFYRNLVSLRRQCTLNISSFIEALNIFAPALIALEVFKGTELELELIRSLVIASSLNHAREVLIEEVRVGARGDEEFKERLLELLDVFVFEADVIILKNSSIAFNTDQSTLNGLSYIASWVYSWQFYDNPSLDLRSGCVCDDELTLLTQLEGASTRVLKELRASFCILEQALGIRHALFPIERVVGLPGAGKTEAIGRMMRADERLGVYTRFFEGGRYIRPIWSKRQSHLTQKELLQLEMERSGNSVLLEYLLKEHDIAYYLYRAVAIKELHLDWIETYLFIKEREAEIAFYIESMPFLPMVAELGLLDVQPRISGATFLGELSTRPEIDPYSYYLLADEELALYDHNSIGTLIRYALINSELVRGIFPYMYGSTVYIDAPIEIYKERLEQLEESNERNIRLKDLEYWSSWRLIYLVLADVFPNIGVVHAAVVDQTEERGYRILSQTQVATLCSLVLTFLRLRMISSDCEVSAPEIYANLIRLRDKIGQL